MKTALWPYVLDIDVIRAEKVAVKDLLTSDPFAVVQLGGKILGKTRLVKRNCSPVWNEHFSAVLLHCQSTLRIKLYDFDYGSSNDDLGFVDFDLSAYPTDCIHNLSKPIILDPVTLATKGTLFVAITIKTREVAVDICRLNDSIAPMQLPLAWFCEVARHIKEYYRIEGPHFTGLRPDVKSVLAISEAETKELISDIHHLLTHDDSDTASAMENIQCMVEYPINRAPMLLSFRELRLQQQLATSHLAADDWISPFLCSEKAFLRVDSERGKSFVICCSHRYQTWAIIRLMRCLCALRAYNVYTNDWECALHLPFVWTSTNLPDYVSGKMLSISSTVNCGVPTSVDASVRGRKGERSVLTIFPGRVSYRSEKEDNGLWTSYLRIDSVSMSSKSDKYHENHLSIDIADIAAVRLKSDSRAVAAEVKLWVEGVVILPSKDGDSESVLCNSSIFSGLVGMKYKYYVIIKPHLSPVFIVELNNKPESSSLVTDGLWTYKTIDNNMMRFSISADDIGNARAAPNAAPVDRPEMPSLVRSNFVAELKSTVSEITANVNSGVDVFVCRGSLITNSPNSASAMSHEVFQSPPDIILHSFIRYSELHMGNKSSSVKKDHRSAAEISVLLDNIPELFITPIRLDIRDPIPGINFRCRFTALNGKVRKTKHSAYSIGAYIETSGKKKASSSSDPLSNQRYRTMKLHPEAGMWWADLVRIEVLSQDNTVVAYAFVPLEEFDSNNLQQITISLLSPAELMTDSLSSLSGASSDTSLGSVVIEISRVVTRQKDHLRMKLAYELIAGDPGYRTGWNAECVSGLTGGDGDSAEVFSLMPGPEGLYLFPTSDDNLWNKDFSSDASKSKDVLHQDMEARVHAQRQHEEKVFLTAQERSQMTNSHLMIPWESVISAVSVSASILAIQVNLHRFLPNSSSSHGLRRNSNTSTVGTFRQVQADVFVTCCPAEELRYLIAHRVRHNELRNLLRGAIVSLKGLSRSSTTWAVATLDNLLNHELLRSSVDVCDSVLKDIGIQLKMNVGVLKNAEVSLKIPEQDSEDEAEDFSSYDEYTDVLSKSVLMHIMRLKLYVAALISIAEIPSSLVKSSNSDLIKWAIDLSSASNASADTNTIFSRFVGAINLEKIVQEDSERATRLAEKRDSSVDINNLELIKNNSQCSRKEISLISRMCRSRVMELYLCSRLLLRDVISVNTGVWESLLSYMANRLVNMYHKRVIAIMAPYFDSVGTLLTQEELVVNPTNYSIRDLNVLLSDKKSENNEVQNDEGVVNKRLVALQIYELLKIFAEYNDAFDTAIRDALVAFTLQPAPTFSLYLSDFLDVEYLIVTWASILVVEMNAWVDSVISQEKRRKTRRSFCEVENLAEIDVEIPWCPKQFEDGCIVSFVPESTASALYNYLNECKIEKELTCASFSVYGQKLESVVKLSFALSFTYLSSRYWAEIKECAKVWNILNHRSFKTVVEKQYFTRILPKAKLKDINLGDDDKLAWLCSVCNDSYRTIVDILNGDIVGKIFDSRPEGKTLEDHIGYSQKEIDQTFDNACFSFKSTLHWAAEALACLILRDTPPFEGNIVLNWSKNIGRNGMFQEMVNALDYHLKNLSNFLNPYSYGTFLVIVCRKVVVLYGNFVRYLHAYVKASRIFRNSFNEVLLNQITEDIGNIDACINYGLRLLPLMISSSEEGIRFRAAVSKELSRLEQLKVLVSNSASSSAVLHVIDNLVIEAQARPSTASALSNMVQACLALRVHAMTKNKMVVQTDDSELLKSELKPKKLGNGFGYFSQNSTDSSEFSDLLKSNGLVLESESCEISEFVAVDILRKISETSKLDNLEVSLSEYDKVFSDIRYWGVHLIELSSMISDFSDIIFLAGESKAAIEDNEKMLNTPDQLSGGSIKLIVKELRCIDLPTLEFKFRKVPLQLHCEYESVVLTTKEIYNNSDTWSDVLEFDVSNLVELTKRQLNVEIFCPGALWGSMCVGHCTFLLVGLSIKESKVKAEINFDHASEQVVSIIKKKNGGSMKSAKYYLEAVLCVRTIANDQSIITMNS